MSESVIKDEPFTALLADSSSVFVSRFGKVIAFKLCKVTIFFDRVDILLKSMLHIPAHRLQFHVGWSTC